MRVSSGLYERQGDKERNDTDRYDNDAQAEETNNGCKRVRDGSNIEPNSAQTLVLKLKEMSSAKDKFEYLCSTVDALKLEKESHKF
jgi:hypothetical protein